MNAVNAWGSTAEITPKAIITRMADEFQVALSLTEATALMEIQKAKAAATALQAQRQPIPTSSASSSEASRAVTTPSGCLQQKWSLRVQKKIATPNAV